jgi:hypothetical protein
MHPRGVNGSSASQISQEERVRIERVLGCHTHRLAFGRGLMERFFGPHSSTFLPAIRGHFWWARVSHTRGERANNRAREVSHLLERKRGEAPPRLRGSARSALVSTAMLLPAFVPQCAVLHSTPSGGALPLRGLRSPPPTRALTGRESRGHAVGALLGKNRPTPQEKTGAAGSATAYGKPPMGGGAPTGRTRQAGVEVLGQARTDNVRLNRPGQPCLT